MQGKFALSELTGPEFPLFIQSIIYVFDKSILKYKSIMITGFKDDPKGTYNITGSNQYLI